MNRRKFIKSASGIFVPALVGLKSKAQVLTLADPARIGTLSFVAESCATLKDSNTGTTGHSDLNIASVDGTQFRATKFVAGSTYSVCKIEFLLMKDGSGAAPTGNVVAYVWADSSGPGAVLATSDAVDAASLPAKGASNYVAFTFSSPASLSSGATYWVGLGKTNLQLNDWVGWYRPNDFVANGNYYSTNATTWVVGSSTRCNFITYSQ